MKKHLAVLLWVLPLSVSAQTMRPELRLLTDSIARDGRITGAYIGEGGMRSAQYDRGLRLEQQATNDELFLLINDVRPAVRSYAFQILSSRNADLTAIVKSHLQDTATIVTQNGCIIGNVMVGDIFLGNFLTRLLNSDNPAHELIVRDMQRAVLYDHNIKLNYKLSMLMSMNAEPGHYDRIREIAQKERLPESVYALAKYRRQEDKAIIAGYLNDEATQYFALLAVKKFPDSSFYPYLVSIFEKEWQDKKHDHSKLRELYQVLALFPNDKTIELFEQTINARNKYRRETCSSLLAVAVKKYPHPRYEKYKDIPIPELYSQLLTQD